MVHATVQRKFYPQTQLRGRKKQPALAQALSRRMTHRRDRMVDPALRASQPSSYSNWCCDERAWNTSSNGNIRSPVADFARNNPTHTHKSMPRGAQSRLSEQSALT